MTVLMSENVFLVSSVLSHESAVQEIEVHEVTSMITVHQMIVTITVLMSLRVYYVYPLSLEATLYSTYLIAIG